MSLVEKNYIAMSRIITPILVHLVIIITLIISNTNGFSIKMIPIESPHLRILPNHFTEHDRLQFLANISMSRVLNFRKVLTPNSMKSKLTNVRSRFITQIGLGEGAGANKLSLLMDTGSDAIWVQCEGCKDCFDLVEGGHFKFRQSPSFRPLSPDDRLCLQPEKKIWGSCGFLIRYGILDPRPTVGGLFGRDTAYLLNSYQTNEVYIFPGLAFGCALQTKNVNFGSPNSIAGIFGLSTGPRSFISQLDAQTKGRFSYCLALFTEPVLGESSLYFGDDAEISGDGTRQVQTISMRLVKNYHLYLNGISVDGKRLPIDPSVFELNEHDYSKGFFIDSGAPYTILTRSAYNLLREAVDQYLSAYGWKAKESGRFLDLCYPLTDDYKQRTFPTVIFHFRNNMHAGDVDMVMEKHNMFLEVSSRNEFCMAVMPINDPGPCLFGALQQMNFNILYDVRNSLLSFVPHDCRENIG